MRKIVSMAWLSLALVPWLAAAPATAAGTVPACTGGISNPRLLTIECRPGYATTFDRIVIHSQRDLDPTRDWSSQLNDTDATWIFDAAADDTANLIIAFARQGRTVSARLFDDQDNDQRILYRLKDGQIVVTEGQGRPTVEVTAQDRWQDADGTPNFNLDMRVDGPVEGMIDAQTLYLDRLRTDGSIDLTVHVRDPDHDGRPDYEWRQAYPPLDDKDGFYHSSVMVNTADDEPPISAALFWPFLGSSAPHFIKEDYASTSAPPINIDWQRSTINYLVESVASRNRPSNYFVYSLRRIKEGQINDVNFESPFAFYQFSPIQSNFPDLALRVAYFPVGDFSQHLATEEIDFSWRQSPRNPDTLPNWDYRLGLTGHNAQQGVVALPEFSLRITPYEKLPGWIAASSWDYATFVARERDNYLSSEGIYEWSTSEGAIVDVNNQERYSDLLLASRFANEQYVLGAIDEVPGKYYHTIRQGLRGEFRSHAGQVQIYFSSIDRKLHLLGADHGVWQIDEQRALRYANLDHDRYLDQWTYTSVTTGTSTLTTTRQLNVAPGHLVYADGSTLLLRQAQTQPSLFESPPPSDRSTWQALGDRIEAHAREFAPDDLRGLMQQFAGPEMQLSGASLRDFRLIGEQGFRFVLTLQPGAQARGAALLDVRALQPGDYVVTYDGSFRIAPLTPPAPAAALHTTTLRQLEPGMLQLSLRNDGLQDLPASRLELWAARPGVEATLVASDTVTLLAQTPISVTLQWSPPSAGAWTITPKLRQADSSVLSLEPARLSITPIRAVSTGALIAASASFTTLPLIIATLIAFAALAAYVWRQQWLSTEVER
ncbi:MAG TPA: hypothetical protein VFZ66_26445 [Herpetosiphonaceae bacterium]